MAILLFLLILHGTGCAQQDCSRIECFMRGNPLYAGLPQGPQRVDAIWEHATEITGSECGALDLLGSLAVSEGIHLQHPFSTGLTHDGTLSPHDKAGHFFASAMWQYHDSERLVPIAKLYGGFWEVLGEIRRWFSSGDGFDWADIWANRLGQEFGRRVYRNRAARTNVRPSHVIAEAESLRPQRVQTPEK